MNASEVLKEAGIEDALVRDVLESAMRGEAEGVYNSTGLDEPQSAAFLTALTEEERIKTVFNCLNVSMDDLVRSMVSWERRAHKDDSGISPLVMQSTGGVQADGIPVTLQLAPHAADSLSQGISTSRQYCDEYLDWLQGRLRSVTQISAKQYTYIVGLSPATVKKAMQAMWFWYTFCRSKGIDPKERFCKKKLHEFIHYLATATPRGPVSFLWKMDSHQANNWKYSVPTVISVVMSLFVAQKIVGVIDVSTSMKRLYGHHATKIRDKVKRMYGNRSGNSERIALLQYDCDVACARLALECSSLWEFQRIVYIQFMMGTGLRPGSVLANSSLGRSGLRIGHIVDINFDSVFQKLCMKVKIPNEKQIKSGSADSVAIFESRDSAFSLPELLLVLLAARNALIVSEEHGSTTIRIANEPKLREQPVFCEVNRQFEVLLTNDKPLCSDKTVWRHVADVLRLPEPLVSARSVRQGFAQEVILGALRTGASTKRQLQDALLSTNRWEGSAAYTYVNDEFIVTALARLRNDPHCPQSNLFPFATNYGLGCNYFNPKSKQLMTFITNVPNKKEKELLKVIAHLQTHRGRNAQRKLSKAKFLLQSSRATRVKYFAGYLNALHYKIKVACGGACPPSDKSSLIENKLNLTKLLNAAIQIDTDDLMLKLLTAKCSGAIPDSGEKCPAAECPESFRMASNMQRHIQSTHTAKSILFVCSLCNKAYEGVTRWLGHVKEVHLSEYACTVCGVHNLTSRQAKTHLRYSKNCSGAKVILMELKVFAELFDGRFQMMCDFCDELKTKMNVASWCLAVELHLELLTDPRMWDYMKKWCTTPSKSLEAYVELVAKRCDVEPQQVPKCVVTALETVLKSR